MPSLRQQITSDLRERISVGEYPPGSHLPTRPELAARYKVNIGTVARALDALRAEGVIETVQGTRSGPLVLRPPEPQPGMAEVLATLEDIIARLERLERHVFGEHGN